MQLSVHINKRTRDVLDVLYIKRIKEGNKTTYKNLVQEAVEHLNKTLERTNHERNV